jgi:bacterial/archaeal transporter family-2 protein
MIQPLLTLMIGMLGGIAVGVQTPLVNMVGRRVGSVASSFVVHLSGTILAAIVLLLYGGENIREWRSLPWWLWLVGGFGVVLVLTINYTIPRIGAAAAITLIIVGQLVATMVIDQFGLFEVPVRPIDLSRIAAVAFLLIGSYLMIR